MDAYAVQHAGGPHPDRSVDVHLTRLLLVLERGVRPTDVPARLQRLAGKVKAWPRFNPPAATPGMTIFDVAMSAGTEDHVRVVREWSAQVWRAWAPHHTAIARFANLHVPDRSGRA